MRINRHDTNGAKPLLGKGELGYDDYTAGGDTGRVYVGTSADNIALAKRLEANMMTKAQFNALANERMANRGGSGFDKMGKHSISANLANVNDGITVYSSASNYFYMGNNSSNGAKLGTSKTDYPSVIVSGILHKINRVNQSLYDGMNNISLPIAPNIYPYDTVLTAEQIASGVIKHADASNSGLIVNGKFDTNTSGWTALNSSLVVESNKLKITNTAASNGIARQSFSTTIGKEYIVEFESISGSHNLGMQIKGDASGITGWSVAGATTGRYTFKYTATTTTTYLLFAVYNNAVGANAYVDNIAVYPADAISRSDLSMAESFHEDIAEKDFSYPLGNTQYLGGNTDGLTGITNGAFTGFETYSLFGNWQTSSALIGKGYVWSTLTEAQKKAFIANPENNCYLDGDKTIQVRYRMRVVQGLGDTWDNIDTQSTTLPFQASGTTKRVLPVGKLTSWKDLGLRDTDGQGYYNIISLNTKDIMTGAWKAWNTSNTEGAQSSVAYEGKCFALPIALVHRRNQGMYHPVYNPNGTKKASDGNFWYNTAVSFTSISDCFDPAKLLTASGYIGSVSGRPDGLFYDQVHEGDITDLRNSSKKVEDYSRLISREFNKLVSGSVRGKEGESDIVMIRTFTKTSTFGKDTNRFYFGISSAIYPQQSFSPTENNSYYLLGNNGSVYSANQVINQSATGTLYIPLGTIQVYIPIDGKNTAASMNTLFPDGTTITVIVVKSSTRTKSNTLLHCDIIGNPNNYPTSWKESGVFGTPLIVAEDGTSLLPDGAKDSFKLSRKANATPLLCLRSTDNGATWTSFTPTFSTTTNAITLTDEPAANLVMIYYQTHTSMAAPVANSEVLELGDVYGTFSYQMSYLSNSLIGKTLIGDGSINKDGYVKLNSLFIARTDRKLYTVVEVTPTLHNSFNFSAYASPAVKVLPYLTRTSGKAYLNLVFKEMKHNGTSWGDDGKFNIVDNVSTTTDNNAQTVLIGQKTVELPYFIGADE